MKRGWMVLLLAVLLLFSMGSFAQTRNISGGRYLAHEYDGWILNGLTTVAAGAGKVVTVDQCNVTTVSVGAKKFNPLIAASTMIVTGGTAETVSITSAAFANGVCTLTATFGQAHTVGNFTFTSATRGLAEAVTDAIANGGGVVTVTPNWKGATSDITSLAVGGTSVMVEDIRAGNIVYYGWSGSAYVAQMVIAAGSVGIGTANLTISNPTSINVTGPNGAKCTYGTTTELLTIAAAATSTTANAALLPANSYIDAVAYRVTTVIPTAATFSIGDGTTVARFGSGIAVAATTNGYTVAQSNPANTNAAGPVQGSAAAIVVTPNAQPADATGRVRLVVFYHACTAPTS